jgi:hypothetical protein
MRVVVTADDQVGPLVLQPVKQRLVLRGRQMGQRDDDLRADGPQLPRQPARGLHAR